MAWHFDESTAQDVQISDNAALTLPDADWTLAGSVKLDDNTGSFYQYFLSWGAYGAQPSLHWYFHEASVGDPNELHVVVLDSDTSKFDVLSTGTPGTNTAWQHVALVRDGSVLTQYVNGVADGSEDDVSVDAVNVTANLYFGLRGVVPDNRALGGGMAEWGAWDRALSADELTALVNGKRPWEFQESLKWHLPMKVGGAGGDYEDWGPSHLTVTNNGSTHANHSPTGLWTPSRVSFPAPVAPGGLSIPIAMHHYKQLMGAA